MAWLQLNVFILVFFILIRPTDCRRKYHHNNRIHQDHSKGFNLLFESVLQEYENVALEFDAPLPLWLQGDVMKNGPARFEFGERNVSHLVDGFAKLVKISFGGNGKATFTTKFLQTDTYMDSVAMNDVAPFMLFASPTPDFNFLEKILASTRNVDNMNVNIYRYNQDYVAVTDSWRLYKLNNTDLSTKNRVDAHVPHGGLSAKVILPLSSGHPMKEYGTENWIDFATLAQVDGATINVVRIKSAYEREFITKIRTEKLHYMHSLAQTQNYAILLAHPGYLNVMTLLKTTQAVDALQWDKSSPTYVYVVHLKTGRVLTLKTERRFTLHHVNSYELGDNTIVVDYITYPDVLVLKNLRLNIIRDPKKRDQLSPNKCQIRRYTLHLNNQTVVPSKLGNNRGLQFMNHFDMPAINENYEYKKYCVVYGLAMKSDDVSLSRFKLIKKNVCDSRKDMYWERRNHYPSEPTFIPRPSAVHEDDGVVISIILDGRRGQSYVGIFDPKTMQLVSKAYLPTVVPFLLHGRHFD